MFHLSVYFCVMIRVWLICLGIGANTSALAQTDDSIFLAGLALEKNFQVEAALEKYELVLKNQPNDVLALTHASRMLSNLAGRLSQTNLDKKRSFLQRAQQYAKKAIELRSTDPHARLAHIISLGLLSEIATNPKEKVVDARLIHEEAIKILEYDTTFAEAYFVLGKWHLELARLNWMELMACKIFFGGFPEAVSTEASLRYFNKALQYNPNSILFMFGQASAYFDLEENAKARITLYRALQLPLAEPDDVIRKERCSALLQQIEAQNLSPKNFQGK